MDEQTKQLELRIQARMGRILFWGMMASALIIVIGGVLFLLAYGGSPPDFFNFNASGRHVKTVAGVVSGIAAYRGGAIIEAGILLLVLFQYVRVIMSALMFARLRHWFFVGVSLFILAVLVYGLFT